MIVGRVTIVNIALITGMVFAVMKSTNHLINVEVGTSSPRELSRNSRKQAKKRANARKQVKKKKKRIEPKIPHRLIFTYKHDIIQTKEPKILYDNIRNTIDAYSEAWEAIYDGPKPEVLFLDDEECIDILYKVAPGLARFFKREIHGAFKADICRIAALDMFGGYYFDADLKVEKPLMLSPTVSFSSVRQPIRKDFFQAFMAVSAGHPILKKALRFMQLHYERKLVRKPDLIGGRTLQWAYESLTSSDMGEVVILEEIWVAHDEWQAKYPDFPLQMGVGCCCNYVVHDPNLEEIYFYSRVMGYSIRCELKLQ